MFFPKRLYVLILPPVLYESLHCFTSLPNTLFWDFASIILMCLFMTTNDKWALSHVTIACLDFLFHEVCSQTICPVFYYVVCLFCVDLKILYLFWWQALLVSLPLIAEHGVKGLSALLGSAVSKSRNGLQGDQGRNGGRANERPHFWLLSSLPLHTTDCSVLAVIPQER